MGNEKQNQAGLPLPIIWRVAGCADKSRNDVADNPHRHQFRGGSSPKLKGGGQFAEWAPDI